MQYRPYWQRIFFLALILHFIFFCAANFFEIFSAPKNKNVEDIQELAWVEVEVSDAENLSEPEIKIPESAEIFPEINLPEIKIPEKNFPEPLPRENFSAQNSTPAESKKNSAENPEDKLVAITKVFPKDVFATLIASGLIKEHPIFSGEKIIIAITIDVKGKVRNIEIRQGGDDIINIVSEAAASGWTFQPYKDSEGNAQEIKTQIEFTSEDF